MDKENSKLVKMLKDNRISESEYQMLLTALHKKTFCTRLENSLLINPFQKIAGFKALLLGLLILVVLSLIGTYTDIYFDGILGYMFPVHLKAMKPNFLLLLYQNCVAWLTLSFLFIITAKLLKLRGIRIIDFFGTVAMARFPLLITLVITLLIKNLDPELYSYDFTKDLELHLNFLGSLGNSILMLCFVWLLMTNLFAFKESSGAEGKKLWYGFICAMALGDMLALIFTRWFLYV
ncbi:MAG: hypothetical protein H0U73_06250 [Tatlockia sp.]|nr:hypothetical protein [Tatlockia sp.]